MLPKPSREALIRAWAANLKTSHKVYIKDKTVWVHREDLREMGWEVIKLSLLLRNEELTDWSLAAYSNSEKDEGWEWKVILGNPSTRKK